MQLRAFWRTFYNLNNLGRFRKGRVLLTGATGFLGAFLLREIITPNKSMYICIAKLMQQGSIDDSFVLIIAIKHFLTVMNNCLPCSEKIY